MAAILCVGDEPALNRSRAGVLRTTGCDVTEGPSSGALRLLDDQNFDMVLLCHTVPAERATQILDAAKQLSPSPQLVVIDTPFGDFRPKTDAVRVDPFEGPRELVQRVCRLLGLSADGADGVVPPRSTLNLRPAPAPHPAGLAERPRPPAAATPRPS